MQAPSRPPARRTLTPAVIVAALFMMASAAVSITFVAARGGLQVPVASAPGAVAAASPTATPGLVATAEPATPGPSPIPTSTGPTPPPSVAPSVTPIGTPSPSNPTTPSASPDSLAVLPGCPGHPGCYLYVVRRGDTLGTISDRWAIGLWIVEALNPEVRDPSTIVIGQTIYLGRSPLVRLDRCPDTPSCYLYVVEPGDRLSTIAGRYGTTTTAILGLNPTITDENEIYSGETIRIPGP